jgi:hypothetical protein
MKNKYSHDEIIRRYKDGQSVSEIAAEMNCHPVTVRRALKEIEKMDKEYRNPEGYADPTAYRAIRPVVSPGEIWTASTHDPDKTKTLLVLQIFDSHALCLWMTNDLSTIPEGCEEKVMFREESFCDCSKPQYAFFSRFVKRVGGITFNRLIDIRKKVADIILRGYAEQTAEDATTSRLQAPTSDFTAELDKIPAEKEKPQETPANGVPMDADIELLKYRATMYESLSGRLLDIVEKAVAR